ncbi:hypothetical protein CWN07_19415 [Klebsiella quasipneumoniae]|uniref:hypothetical protein n=1 Tax=Klebsiella quasipneumoniae TaxID=1463165 RepID=UPI000C7B8E2C|nr:hypothetical protein [Klebsiella quasipneumoniae]PLN00541.1 hypothetical protein CWN07_19415 [Klebsiella quasipneumoniae]PLO88413.1 hypothetical protein CWN03_12200 [Klebsiella quasipneumoniae]
MAISPSHSLGQIIGYAMELAFFEIIKSSVSGGGYYVDRQGSRSARGFRKKVTWIDYNKNKHDLDFVIEKNGTDEVVGIPVAFIESAWRRYTKHSVNKAGEIANALIPLRQTYKAHNPFIGAIVAGEWTTGGLIHMKSQGINVVHIPVPIIINAFECVGLDFNFNEDTSTDDLQYQVDKWNSLSYGARLSVVDNLIESTKPYFYDFTDELMTHLSRKIDRIIIIPLYGDVLYALTLDEAINVIHHFDSALGYDQGLELKKIEIQLRFSNLDKIDASFTSKRDAIEWLELNKSY